MGLRHLRLTVTDDARILPSLVTFGLPPLLVLATGLVTLDFEFVYDVPPILRAAEQVAGDPLGLLSSMRRPIKTFTFAFDTWLFGGAPWGYHLHSVLWAALNALLATYIAFLISSNRRASVAAGILFAIHPVHVEAVAAISARKDLLAFAFGAGAIAVTCRSFLDGRIPRLARLSAASGLLLLSLLSKEVVAVAALGVIITLAFLGFRIKSRESEGLPIGQLALFAAILVAAALLLGQHYLPPFDQLYSADRLQLLSGNEIDTPGDWILRSFAGAAQSGVLLFLSVGLSADHPHPPGGTAGAVGAALGLLFLLGTFVLGFFVARHNRLAAVGLMWFLPTMLPIMNLLPLSKFFIADRYLYLPSLGAALIASSALDLVATSREEPARQFATPAWYVALGLITILAITYGNSRFLIWRDPRTMWTATCRDSPTSPRAHFFAGVVRLLEKDFEGALRYLSEANRLSPESPEIQSELGIAHNNVGAAFAARGDFSTASQHFALAARFRPLDPDVLCNLGKTHLLLHQLEAAAEALERGQHQSDQPDWCRALKVRLITEYDALSRFCDAAEVCNEHWETISGDGVRKEIRLLCAEAGARCPVRGRRMEKILCK